MSERKADIPDISPITVQQVAEIVFESEEIARKWLEQPVNALGGYSPSELLRTTKGCRQVYQVLSKIEAGDFS